MRVVERFDFAKAARQQDAVLQHFDVRYEPGQQLALFGVALFVAKKEPAVT
jgi:hypothetical protein